VVTVCALSFFMTWLYCGSGGSVLATIMAHAAWNAAVGVQDRLAVPPDRRLPLVSAALLLAISALTVSRVLRSRQPSGCTEESGAAQDGAAKGTIYRVDDWGDDRPPNSRLQQTPPGEKMRRRR
jgi:hypothetical protein